MAPHHMGVHQLAGPCVAPKLKCQWHGSTVPGRLEVDVDWNGAVVRTSECQFCRLLMKFGCRVLTQGMCFVLTDTASLHAFASLPQVVRLCSVTGKCI